MEAGLGSIHWLHGLEDYFEFINDNESKQFVRFLLKLLYADKPAIMVNEESSMEEFIYTLRKFSNSPMMDVLYKYYREGHEPLALQDAFSRGQVQSKIWLATELSKVKKDFDMVYVLAGWFGQLTSYFDAADINYNKIRIMDIDPVACEISDKIFNATKLENYKVKSVERDLTDYDWLSRTGCEYILKNYNNNQETKEKTSPDLIINTSAEHFHERWYHKFANRPLETNPIFVIQTNNLFNVPEHINCVHSIDEMKIKFPMDEVLFEGELQLKGYKRFMLIGRP
jgi:hypothetical protein